MRSIFISVLLVCVALKAPAQEQSNSEQQAAPAKSLGALLNGFANTVNGAIQGINRAAAGATAPQQKMEVEVPVTNAVAGDNSQAPITSAKNNSGIQTSPFEFMPLIKGYKNGCEVHNDTFLNVLAWLSPNDDGAIAKKPDFPGDLYRVLGKPSVKDKGDHWLTSVPVSNAVLNGLKLAKIDRWQGKGNGINGFAMAFNAPTKLVKAAFKNERFKAGESGATASIVFDSKTGITALACDSSM